MNETVVGLIFLLPIACLGLAIYVHGKKYEETKRLKDVIAPREDDLQWSLKHTTVAYGVRNNAGNMIGE
jgi:cadmium resistance protein CadD (predicted permease)